MPAFEGAVRARLPLRRDRRARDRRRRAARVPRRRPRPGHRLLGRHREAPWDVVREARVDGREPIPLLEELLGTFPDLRINIDPKHDAAVQPLIDVIEKFDAVSRVCIGSFSDKRLARLRKALGPELCTALGPKGVRRLVVASRGFPAGRFHQPCAQVPTHSGSVTIVNQRFVDAAHARGIAVHVWTIDDDRRDGTAARPRGRRDHDRPAGGAAGGARRRGQWVS